VSFDSNEVDLGYSPPLGLESELITVLITLRKISAISPVSSWAHT